MKKFNQGGLDSLCGIYSIVNAERHINGTTADESQLLYNSIINYLEKNGKLASTLIEGMLFNEITSIFNDVSTLKLKKEQPYANVKTPPLNEFLSTIQSLLQKSANSVALVGLSGKHDHWTVITKITPSRIRLLDSGTLQHFNTNNCTTGKMSDNENVHKGKTHVLYPAQTYILSK